MVATEIGLQPSLAELVRLEDPGFYLDPHPVYDRMRREQPVYYYPPLDIFVLTRHADMREAARRPDSSQAQLRQAATVFGEMNGFLLGQFDAKRASPGDDLMSVLLGEELDGAPLSAPRLLTYCHQVLSVGNDTTRSLLASFAIALAQHPDQLDLLAADRTLMPAAIEEALRWSTPGRGFVRTATRDTEIAGRQIRAGQRIYLLYAAGNFDPAVFPQPRRFDIRRDTDQPHLAFGFGPHVCLAAQLVRLVTALLFGALLDRYPRFELAGPPEPIRHVLRNGWRSPPIVFGTSS